MQIVGRAALLETIPEAGHVPAFVGYVFRASSFAFLLPCDMQAATETEAARATATPFRAFVCFRKSIRTIHLLREPNLQSDPCTNGDVSV